MKHLIFLNSIEDLVVEKDSTLLLAHTLKERKQEVYLLFEENFHILSDGPVKLQVFDFNSSFPHSFSVTDGHEMVLDHQVLFHMRLDPPFDERYLQFLWMMNDLKRWGVRFLNDPQGILLFNEKITSFQALPHLQTYVGNSEKDFISFAKRQKESGHKDLILKPLHLYQGIGVEKVSLSDCAQLKDAFQKKIKTYNGAVLAQPFVEEISKRRNEGHFLWR